MRPARLQDLVDETAEPETLDGDNRWICGGCHRRVRAAKTTTLGGPPPPVLALHLKRFAFGPGAARAVGWSGGGGGGVKRSDAVSYPASVTLGPALLPPPPAGSRLPFDASSHAAPSAAVRAAHLARAAWPRRRAEAKRGFAPGSLTARKLWSWTDDRGSDDERRVLALARAMPGTGVEHANPRGEDDTDAPDRSRQERQSRPTAAAAAAELQIDAAAAAAGPAAAARALGGERGQLLLALLDPPAPHPVAAHALNPNPSRTYTLAAVCLHHGGSATSGHYTALATSAGGHWSRHDDSYTDRLRHPADALAEPRDAYMLFYTQDPPAEPDAHFLGEAAALAAVTAVRPDVREDVARRTRERATGRAETVVEVEDDGDEDVVGVSDDDDTGRAGPAERAPKRDRPVAAAVENDDGDDDGDAPGLSPRPASGGFAAGSPGGSRARVRLRGTQRPAAPRAAPLFPPAAPAAAQPAPSPPFQPWESIQSSEDDDDDGGETVEIRDQIPPTPADTTGSAGRATGAAAFVAAAVAGPLLPVRAASAATTLSRTASSPAGSAVIDLRAASAGDGSVGPGWQSSAEMLVGIARSPSLGSPAVSPSPPPSGQPTSSHGGALMLPAGPCASRQVSADASSAGWSRASRGPLASVAKRPRTAAELGRVELDDDDEDDDEAGGGGVGGSPSRQPLLPAAAPPPRRPAAATGRFHGLTSVLQRLRAKR